MSTTNKAISKRFRRLPLSVPNMVLVGSCLLGAIATILLGNWFGTAALVVLGGGGLLSALLARRPGSSDWLRINAIEYRDERDSRLASHGFAVVGAWALALATLEFVAATVYAGAVLFTHTSSGDGDVTYVLRESGMIAGALETVAALQVFVLCVVWGIANTRAVQRG
jgi:hypothetical protein